MANNFELLFQFEAIARELQEDLYLICLHVLTT